MERSHPGPPVQCLPLLCCQTGPPCRDDYLSVREPSEFEYDSEETDPREIEDGPEEDDASVSSDSTYKSNGHDTDRTRRTNTSNCNHRRNQRKWKDHRFRHPSCRGITRIHRFTIKAEASSKADSRPN